MILTFLIIFSLCTISWLFGFFVGFCVALYYAKSYYDNSEYDGKRNWESFRKLKIWKYTLHKYFNFKIIFTNEEENKKWKGPM